MFLVHIYVRFIHTGSYDVIQTKYLSIIIFAIVDTKSVPESLRKRVLITF